MFDYNKWLNPKVKNQSSNVAISAIPAIQNTENSRNSKNSNSEEAEMKKYGDFTATQLKQFLGEDWELYKDNPEALVGWADLLSKRRQMEHGQVPKDFTAVTHCSCCSDVFVPPAIAERIMA